MQEIGLLMEPMEISHNSLEERNKQKQKQKYYRKGFVISWSMVVGAISGIIYGM